MRSIVLLALFLTAAILSFTYNSFAKEVDVVILDVRTPQEFNTSHIHGAENVDFEQGFKEKIAQLDRHKSYKLYCKSGNRAGRAIQLMRSMGFTRLENLGGLKNASKRLKMACSDDAYCR